VTFGSLFAGIGGMDLGLERAGMRCAWQVEIDDYARRVLEKHWPDVRRWDDVRTFPPAADAGSASCGPEGWSVDLIAGGDPCQENSAARTVGSTQSPSLGGEFIRVIDAIRPRLVLRENPARVRRDAPWPWWRMREGLERIGYVVLPFRLRACCVGADHQRDRLFLLAELADANGNGLERRPRETPRWFSAKPPRHMEVSHWPDIPTDIGSHSRAGIPGYVDQLRGLGNAVVPQVAEWIGRRIMEHAEAAE
jgi:DNA (cytosine-5)-methyltransferase 1